MSRVTGALVAVVVLLGLAAPGSAATAASSATSRDPARDVLSRGLVDDGKPRRPEPARRVGDVVRMTASYGTDLVVTTKLRSVASTDDQDFTWYVKTSEDRYSWYADYSLRGGRDRGVFVLIDPVANQPGCGRAQLDRATRTVTLTIPADCLGDPAWVRVSHGVRTYDGSREYADDAQRAADVRNGGWKLGPRLTQ